MTLTDENGQTTQVTSDEIGASGLDLFTLQPVKKLETITFEIDENQINTEVEVTIVVFACAKGEYICVCVL